MQPQLSDFGEKLNRTLLTALEKRRRIIEWEPQQCIRLVNHECSDIKCDQLGEYLALFWYNSFLPTKQHLNCFDRLTVAAKASGWILFPRIKSSKETEALFAQYRSNQIWQAKEGEAIFEFRGNHGISPGLFLDQREQRKFVREHSSNQRVLNLFSYTGGFTVNALLGGASSVFSVDTSRSAQEWAQINVALNKLDIVGASNYATEDVRRVLRRLVNRSEQFDLIICDPPSFSRGKQHPFSLKQAFGELVQLSCELLAPNGNLLLSCNLESWSRSEFPRIVEREYHRGKLQIKSFEPTFDFADQPELALKSVRISKKS
jgi:23S rRNA (cytosine1962-C5)-methyltransferase